MVRGGGYLGMVRGGRPGYARVGDAGTSCGWRGRTGWTTGAGAATTSIS